jgi:glyoxylate reductase
LSDPSRSAPPRVFVTRSLSGLGVPDPLAPLLRETDCRVFAGPGPIRPHELVDGARGCAGLLCLLTDRIDAALLQACPELRVISSMSVGVDHIDLDAASARGIGVGHTPGVLTETSADLTFGLMLAAARRIPEADRFVREALWVPDRRWEPDMLLGADVHRAVLGVIGLGAIGRAVCRRAQGFGMRILGWTRSQRQLAGVESVGLEELLAHSDFVSVNVAYAPETRGLLGREQIAAMKAGAVLVNTSRGGIVDESAVAEALHSGRLGAAALDVFAEEPLPAESSLLDAPNLILTPHIGSASLETRRRMASLAVENLLAGLAGRPLPQCANADRLEAGPAVR